MSRSSQTRKLRLHRETLRVVSASDLAAAAGGSGLVTTGGVSYHNPSPRSTVWSGGAINYGCA